MCSSMVSTFGKTLREVRKMIGYMPDFFGVYDQLKADEYLDFYGASYGIPEAERKNSFRNCLNLSICRISVMTMSICCHGG